MEHMNKKMMPFLLPVEAENFWGLLRIMNLGKLTKDDRSIYSPNRNKSIVSTVTSSTARVFYIGSKVGYDHEEFNQQQKKFKTVLIGDQAEQISPRATGLASLMIGQCYGIAPGAELVNIVVNKNEVYLMKALSICLEEAQKSECASVIFLEEKPDLLQWQEALTIITKLKEMGIELIVPAGEVYLKEAINVAAVDINDEAIDENSADMYAPGVNIASLDLSESSIQNITGHDAAAAFVTGVSLLHLSAPSKIKLQEKLFSPLSRIQFKNKLIPMLWNPYQVYEPAWDPSQDPFLGAFAWNQKVDIPLKMLNIGIHKIELAFVHNDLPKSFQIIDDRLIGETQIGEGTCCYHFVISAQHQGTAVSKMFYLTVTDNPQMLDLEGYQSLNIVAKSIPHYGGADPNPPAFPPYHFESASCVSADTLIHVKDGRGLVRIDQLKAGDLILNENGETSEVYDVVSRTLDGQSLYRVNKNLVITQCHWLKTNLGTAAIKPDGRKDLGEKEIIPLQMGMFLETADGKEIEVVSIDKIEDLSPETKVYNLVTHDDCGYYCNGILSKTELFAKGIFLRDPQFKGKVLEFLFSKRRQYESFRAGQ